MTYATHPHSCGGPGLCGRCDNVVDHRDDRTPAEFRAERADAAARSLERGDVTMPPCAARWRDGWHCRGDATGLHACRKRGPHTVHSCEAQTISDRALEATR